MQPGLIVWVIHNNYTKALNSRIAMNEKIKFVVNAGFNPDNVISEITGIVPLKRNFSCVFN